jgi:hypothetical protein
MIKSFTVNHSFTSAGIILGPIVQFESQQHLNTISVGDKNTGTGCPSQLYNTPTAQPAGDFLPTFQVA